MDRTIANIREIHVPGEDGTIGQALASLDERLVAWAAAMREACRQLAEAASRRAPAVAAEPPSDTASPEPPVASLIEPPVASFAEQAAVNVAEPPVASIVEPASDEAPQAVTLRQTRIEVRPEPEKPVAAQSQSEATNAQGAATTTPHTEAPTGTIRVTAAASAPVVAAEPPKRPSPVAEDEALLASLDPETAKAVRVMRRLSPECKSVREWLKEYEANRPAQQPVVQPKKKSWFSRG